MFQDMSGASKSELWTYRRLEHPGVVEASDWRGSNCPSLVHHFHHEPQITAVASGNRWFKIGRRTYQISEGCFAVIPARIPHTSVGKIGRSTVSRDVFINPAALEDEAEHLLFGRLPKGMINDENATVQLVLHAVRLRYLRRIPALCSQSIPAEILEAVRSGQDTISDLARSVHLSREGFIRKFDREIGMTPYAYRLAERVSLARAKLRNGETPVSAAYEVGFADQSHLGRVFRKAFGTTPARFRQAWRV